MKKESLLTADSLQQSNWPSSINTHTLCSLKKYIACLYLFICSTNSFFEPFAGSQDLNKLSEECLDLLDVYVMQFLFACESNSHWMRFAIIRNRRTVILQHYLISQATGHKDPEAPYWEPIFSSFSFTKLGKENIDMQVTIFGFIEAVSQTSTSLALDQRVTIESHCKVLHSLEINFT